jgi:hypothetical protein
MAVCDTGRQIGEVTGDEEALRAEGDCAIGEIDPVPIRQTPIRDDQGVGRP